MILGLSSIIVAHPLQIACNRHTYYQRHRVLLYCSASFIATGAIIIIVATFSTTEDINPVIIQISRYTNQTGYLLSAMEVTIKSGIPDLEKRLERTLVPKKSQYIIIKQIWNIDKSYSID